jgi:lipid II isoglutaminyl synthase (glutamine-hydrolysing)
MRHHEINKFLNLQMIRLVAAVAVCKCTRYKQRLQNMGGTALPGKRAQEICPDFLELTSRNVSTVLVTGTNGKTTTTRMISTMMDAAGIRHFSNRSGANMPIGIASEYGMNASFLGRGRKKWAVMECDEGYAASVARAVNPKVIVITDILVDQLYRLKGIDRTVDLLMECVHYSPDAVVCIKSENEGCRKLIGRLDDNNRSKVVQFSAKNYRVVISGQDPDTGIFEQEYQMNLDMPGAYNLYNAAAACAAAKTMNILSKNTIHAVEHMPLPFGRMEKIDIGGAPVMLTLVKNTSSCNAVLEMFDTPDSCYIFSATDFPRAGLVLFFGVNDGLTDDMDLTWLAGINWKIIKDTFETIYSFGTCAETVKSLIGEKCAVIDSDAVLNEIKKKKCPCHVFANYTCMMNIRHIFADNGYVREFWKD